MRSFAGHIDWVSQVRSVGVNSDLHTIARRWRRQPGEIPSVGARKARMPQLEHYLTIRAVRCSDICVSTWRRFISAHPLTYVCSKGNLGAIL